jgi:hypothetical protein
MEEAAHMRQIASVCIPDAHPGRTHVRATRSTMPICCASVASSCARESGGCSSTGRKPDAWVEKSQYDLAPNEARSAAAAG